MIAEVKERLVRVQEEDRDLYLKATVRNGEVTELSGPTNNTFRISKAYLERYIVFLKEVIEAIDQSSLTF